MPKDLTALFSPRSVVVVGASRSPEKVGAIILQNILASGFKGEVYAVNPNIDSVGEIKCFKDVTSLPEVPDLAVFAIPVAAVIDVLTQAGEKGIKNVVVITAGFKEAGADGVVLEKQLEAVASKFGINLLGPNCLGFVNAECPINATFGKVGTCSGNLRFISQSGAIAASLFDWCASIGLGFSDFVTLGNKAVLNENDVLEYFYAKTQGSVTSLVHDGEAKVHPIGLYLESISNGSNFIKLARQISQRDPIFIIKPGKSQAAAKAMQSHTGAMAGADDVLDAALTQAGILRCQTLEDFFDMSKAFSWENLPAGPRVAVVSNAGGPAVICADAIVSEALQVAEFDDELKKKLLKVLPRAAGILDPVDVLGDALADRFGSAMDIILQTDKCDALVVILTPQVMTQVEKTAEIIGTVSKKYNKPIFCAFMGGSLVAEGEQKLNELKIPAFRFPERAISAIAAMWRFRKQQDKLAREIPDISVLNSQSTPVKVAQIIDGACKAGHSALDNLEANTVIAESGISTPQTLIPDNLESAIDFAKNVSYPVVLKLSSPGLLHKKHLGGVILDIKSDEQLETAWDTLERKCEHLDPAIKTNVKFQIQKEVPNGVEVLVGVKHDPTFGSVFLFGAGGSLTELIADKNLHLLPIDINYAKELVQNSKVWTALKGSDTEPPYALDKLYDVIVKLSRLAASTPEIEEIEINPVIVTLNDVWAVDTKVILEPNRPKPAGPKFKVATTLSVELLAGKTRYFEFEMQEASSFRPGSYVSVKVSDTRINCYSIAGQTAPTKFNLLVDSTPGGPGSKFFENIKVGDKMTYLGPFGTFELKPSDGATNLLFLATGSGTAPLKYMVESLVTDKKNKKTVSFYWGVNNFEDIFLKDYYDKLAAEHKNFKFQIAVRNPNPAWKGAVGFINELVKKDFPDAKTCSAYLCGSKFMITDATNILISAGCPAERIYTEKI